MNDWAFFKIMGKAGGRIPSSGFFVATTEDMKYMQKHFVPSFDEEALENHLNMIMSKKKGKNQYCGED